jgi:hypothetical protein
MHAFQILYTSEAINDSHCVINCSHYVQLYSHNLIIKLVNKLSSSFAINAAKRRTNPLQDESKSRYKWVIQSWWRSPNEAHDKILVMLIKTYHWHRSRGGGAALDGQVPVVWRGRKRAAVAGTGWPEAVPLWGLEYSVLYITIKLGPHTEHSVRSP